jgi:uncharacterized protein (DUF433 family)
MDGLQASMPALDRIISNPHIMGGKPVIRGTRVTVSTVVGLIAAGRTIDEVLSAYPYITREDILEALSYAAWKAGEAEIELAQE